MLIAAARARRTLAYGELLRFFGRRPAPRNVAALCRDLGRLEARLRPHGVPDLACLVVRAADGVPGVGWFTSERRAGAFDGPPEGPAARAHLHACQERAFAWASGVGPAGLGATGAGAAGSGADSIPDPGQDSGGPTDRSGSVGNRSR